MYVSNRFQKTLITAFLFVYITLAQDTAIQSLNGLDVFSSQKPCARGCFTGVVGGCSSDNIASAIGCGYNYCADGPVGALNNCYCRPDLQSVAASYLTSCVKRACTIGDSSIDISSAGSIYSSYCTSKGFLATAVNVPATTTNAGAQSTTTVASLPSPQTSSFGNGASISSLITTTAPTATSLVTNAGSVTTAVSEPSSQGGGGGGYSTSDKIALGVGLGLGITTLILGIYACMNQIRRRF